MSAAFDAEIALARTQMAAGSLDAAMRHLERAHVIGQLQVWPHVLTHWLMLVLELRRGRPLAAFGQLARILLGAIGSAVGVVPTGNTGGSDISMFQRLPVNAELQALVETRPRNRFAQSAPLAWVMAALLAGAMAWPSWQSALHGLFGVGRHNEALVNWPLVLAALALAVLLSSPALLPARRAALCKLLAVGLMFASFFLLTPVLAFGMGLLVALVFRDAGRGPDGA